MSVHGTGSTYLDAAAVARWSERAVGSLAVAEAGLNAINVFPVRDGDTGTNLLITARSAAAALAAAADADGPAYALQALAAGAVAGARGNSGALLAQWWSAWAAVRARTWDAGEVAGALTSAARAARDALARPVEGTLISVADEAADVARVAAAAGLSVPVVLAAAVQGAVDALARTPTQLAELRQAGVVDAGGRGLVLVLRALLEALVGEPSDPPPTDRPAAGTREPPVPTPDTVRYEVQYTVGIAERSDAADLRSALDRLGDSVVVAGSVPGPHSVHVHTADPGAAIERALSFGVPHGLSVQWLAGSPAELPPAVSPDAAVVYLTSSPELATAMASEGARALVWDDASGAPDPAAVLGAVLACGAGQVTLLPNDRRARPVADAVAGAAAERGVEVAVVPSRSVMQGLAALAVHSRERPFAEDVIGMTDAAAATRTVEVTIAESDAVTYAGRCAAGDLLGLIDGEVVGIGHDLSDVALDLVGRLIAAGGELVTVLVGAGGAPAGRAVQDFVRSRHPLVEITLLPVGQTNAPLLIGVE